MSIYSSPELLASWFQKRFKFFNSLSEQMDLGVANLDLRGMVGRVYLEYS